MIVVLKPACLPAIVVVGDFYGCFLFLKFIKFRDFFCLIGNSLLLLLSGLVFSQLTSKFVFVTIFSSAKIIYRKQDFLIFHFLRFFFFSLIYFHFFVVVIMNKILTKFFLSYFFFSFFCLTRFHLIILNLLAGLNDQYSHYYYVFWLITL